MLSLVVDVLPAKDAADKAERERQDAEHKSFIDNVTVVIGGLTLAALFLQLAAFIFQALYMRRTVGEMQTATAAAVKATNAAVGVEVPRFILKSVTITSLLTEARRALESGSVYITFTNHGRTAAAILGEHFDWRVCVRLPERPEYKRDRFRFSDIGAVVDTGADYTMSVPQGSLCIIGRPITDEEATKVLRGEEYLWLYGFVAYRDFLEDTHRIGFCLRLDVMHARFTDTKEIDRGMILALRFVQDGPPAYTYKT